jgi:hypothetical protein
VAVTVPLWYGRCGTWRHRTLLLAVLAVVVPVAAVFVLHVSPQQMEASGNPAEVAAGRLVSGIRNVGTDGQQGENVRFRNTAGVIAAVRANGWMRLGAGPDADAVYFAAVRPAGGGVTAGVNALWVSVLADFGEGGLAVLAVMLVVATWRMGRYPETAAILLPLFAASLVNSAIPNWTFAALGIMLFAFGWMPVNSARPMPVSRW